jgi:hypothetical protein
MALSVFVISGHLVVGSTPTTGPGLGRSERVTYGPLPEVAGARRSMKNGHYSVLRAIECSYRMRSQLRTLQSPNWNHAAN